MTAKYRGQHTGCTGDACPHCPKLGKPGYEKVTAHLTGQTQPARPVRPARPACKHRGPETGLVDCSTCNGGVRIKTFACARHGQCTIAKAAPGFFCCDAPCADYAAPTIATDPDALYVQVERHSDGIGDHAIIVMACEELQLRTGRRVILHTHRGDVVPWMRLFWPHVVTGELPAGATAMQPLGDRPLGRRAKSRWQHCADRAGVARLAIPPLAEPLPADAVQAVWHLQGSVILVPEANSQDRPWPLPSWMDLEARLLHRGCRPVVIGTNAASLSRFRSLPYVGQEPARVVALLRSAACVIGNDSGMVHLAGLLGTPAVALCGLVGGERVFGAYRTVRWIDGPLACNGCEWHDAERGLYNCARCASLDLIAPAQVLQAVEELTCRRAWDYTLLPPGPRASLQRAARETAELPGALAELGVRQGGASLIMTEAAPGKHIHLFDTFCGMPRDDPDGGNNHKGKHAAARQIVEGLIDRERCSVHEGVFPDTTRGLEDERYACAHLDADHYAPTVAAIDYFWPRLVPGGRIVFDDWRRGDCPGIERAIRERFAAGQIEETAEYQCTVRRLV